ncbi:MAG: glycosyltransferase family 2 protein [Lactobacillus sp.]|nr:glycosyltransferase family 2 protein [Lactobacillus sp.]
MDKVSIVVPCFNEEEALHPYYEAMSEIRKTLPFEIEFWMVNDGSRDNTLEVIKELHAADPSVHYISFSRNFGKESAMYAGLKAATGDYVVVMDADLQDPPEFLDKMYSEIQEKGLDCVGTRRVDREGEPKVISFFSNLFYKVINRMIDFEIVPGARDFRMMNRKMVNAVIAMPEYSRFSKGIFSWVGFKTEFLEYPNIPRVAGETSWNFWKLFKYAMDGIADFSQLPLAIAAWIGSFSSLAALIGFIGIIIRHMVTPAAAVDGWSSMVCVVLLMGGLQMLTIGIIGRYIGKIYLQVKNRPIYIISEKE